MKFKNILRMYTNMFIRQICLDLRMFSYFCWKTTKAKCIFTVLSHLMFLQDAVTCMHAHNSDWLNIVPSTSWKLPEQQQNFGGLSQSGCGSNSVVRLCFFYSVSFFTSGSLQKKERKQDQWNFLVVVDPDFKTSTARLYD